MVYSKFSVLNFFMILMCNVKSGWSEVCSSAVEDITVYQCNPNQRSSINLVDTLKSDSSSSKSCNHFIDNVSYRVVNAEHGIVNYHIVLPPASCQYTRYIFKMIASNASLCARIEEITSGRALSAAQIRSDYADELGVKTVRVTLHNDTRTCSNDLDLVFEYVSTQCYQLVVQPFISQDSQIQLYSNWHSIDTAYKPIYPHLYAPQFDWRHDKIENSVSVRLIIHSTLTARPIASCVEIMAGVDASGSHACYESGSRVSQCLVWFGDTEGHSSLHRCDKDRDSDSAGVSKCTSEMHNELVCSIENVTSGHYCVVMKFLDERCQGSESACSWHKMFAVTNRSVLAPSYSSLFPPTYYSPFTHLSSMLLITLSLLLLLGVAALLILKTCHAQSLSMRRYKHFVLPLSRTPSSVADSMLEERQVLLLYARDCRPVAQVVADFKTLLQLTGKCQVFDFWDVHQFNSVARNPLAWINAHLSNDKMHVIIINTPVARLLLQNQMPLETTPNHRTEQPDPSHAHAQGFTCGGQCSPSARMNGGASLDPGPATGEHCSRVRSQETASVLSKRQAQTDDQCMPLLSEAHACQSGRVTSRTHACRQLNVTYKESKCFDSLFGVALGCVARRCASHPTRNLPERVYSVGFDADDPSLCSSFLLPVTLTRFILPQHAESLLYHIHSLSPLTKQFTLDSSDDYLKLKHSIDLMLNFRRTEPHYLLDLLVNVV